MTMSCCGSQRARAAEAARPAAPAKKTAPSAPSIGAAATDPLARRPAAVYTPASPRIYFRYIGETALTVFGSVSQTRYRFTAPGATAAVDPRDAPELARMPHLRQVNRV